jgi:hypothetical protein
MTLLDIWGGMKFNAMWSVLSADVKHGFTQNIPARWRNARYLTLNDRVVRSVLVSIRIIATYYKEDGHVVSEVSLAVLRVHEQLPPLFPGLWYYDTNEIKGLTVFLRHHKCGA